MITAESLFLKFRRLVETVDKKGNFPPPRKEAGRVSIVNGDPIPMIPGANKNKGKDAEPERVITPELRKLLSRNVEVLPRKTVAQKGDGMPSK